MVSERLDISDDARGDYAEGCVENAKRYSNYIDETTHPYVSNISLPWPYIVIESYLGKCVQMLAGVLPYVRVVEEDDDSRQKAKAVEKDANMVLYKQKWPILAYNLYKQAFKFGTVFLLERPWELYKGEEMPVFSVMNWFKVWTNPNCLYMDDDDQYLIYETFIPQRSFKKFAGNPNYKNLTNVQAIESIEELHGEEEKSIRTYKGLADLKYDPYSKLVKTWVYWTNEDWHIVTNEDNVIRNGKNFLGKIPVKCIKPIPVEDEFYGMSILEQGKDLFAEASENRNQYNDAVNLMLNPQYIIGRNCDVKKTNITAKARAIKSMSRPAFGW